MADLAITAASVKKGSGAQISTLNAATGVTITAGQGMYSDTTVTPAVWRLANSTTSATTASMSAIALNAAQPGQPVVGQTGGQITIGATLVAGDIYLASATSGNITIVSATPATGVFVTIVGVAISTTVVQLSFNATGIAHG
jgi:hypothetical protein